MQPFTSAFCGVVSTLALLRRVAAARAETCMSGDISLGLGHQSVWGWVACTVPVGFPEMCQLLETGRL